MLFFACNESPNTAQEELDSFGLNKSAPMIIGEIECDFTFTPPTFWNGTIDFGSYGIYSITFISSGPPRDYSQASPFIEDFVIYELGSDRTIPANVYMKGNHKGVVVKANKDPNPSKFNAQGKVLEAYGPLADWIGCTTHTKNGLVYWVAVGSPERCTAIMQIN